jgi:flagellar protein FlaG
MDVNSISMGPSPPAPVSLESAGMRAVPAAQSRGSGEASSSQSRISEALLQQMEEAIEKVHQVGLTFSVDEATGRTVIRVSDRDTGELIREIPPKEILDLQASMEEMIGILFNKNV